MNYGDGSFMLWALAVLLKQKEEWMVKNMGNAAVEPLSPLINFSLKYFNMAVTANTKPDIMKSLLKFSLLTLVNSLVILLLLTTNEQYNSEFISVSL